MNDLVIKPGKATLADWQAVLDGAKPSLDPSCRDKVVEGAVPLEELKAAIKQARGS